MPRSKQAYETDWLTDERVRLLRELVQINSGTLNIAGVNAVQTLMQDRLRSLGLSTHLEPHDQDPQSSGNFLWGELAAADRTGPVVSLVTHADTVFEKDSGFLEFGLDLTSACAHGPGVIDDKGGMVVAWEGLRRFIERTPLNDRRIRIRYLVAPSEETGSHGFHRFLSKMGRESWMALGFEPALEDGSIVRSRRGNRWYRIEVRGRAAHSGRHLEHGVNAAHELAHKLVELAQLHDPKAGITLSTGSLKGGQSDKFNIVCPEAEARIDVRFNDFDAREQVHQRIESIIGKNHIHAAADGALPSASYSLADDCPPFVDSGESAAHVSKYIEIISDLEERPIRSERSGGAADVNYMSRPGLYIIDGLGPYGGGMHRRDEFIELASLETRSEALARFLTHLNQSQIVEKP